MPKKLFFVILFLSFCRFSPIYSQFKEDPIIDTLWTFLDYGKYKELLFKCDSLIEIYSERKDLANLSFAISLTGAIDRQEGNFEKAIATYQQVLELRLKSFGEKSRLVGNTYLNIGNCLLDLQDPDSAIQFLEKAEGIIGVAAENADDLSDLYLSIGEYYRQKENYILGKQYFQKALSYIAEGDARKRRVHIHQANLLFEASLQNRAIGLLEKTLKEGIEDSTIHPREAVLILSNLSNFYLEQGEYVHALELSIEALQSLESLQQVPQLLEGTCLERVGNCFQELGELDMALNYYLPAISKMGMNQHKKALILNQIGNCYRYQRRFQEAQRYLNESRSYLEQYNERAVSPLIEELGEVYANLGSCYLEEGILLGDSILLNHSLKHLRHSLFLFQNIGNSIDHEFKLLNKIGVAYLNMNDLVAAQRHFEKGRQMKIGDNPILVSVSDHNLGKLFMAKDSLTAAIRYYDQALSKIESRDEISEENAYPYELIQSYTALAKAKMLVASSKDSSDVWFEVLELSRKAIRVLEELKGNFHDYQSEIDLNHTFYDVYSLEIEALIGIQTLKPGDQDDQVIFGHIEKYKSILLKHLMRNRRRNHPFQQNSVALQLQGLSKRIADYKKERFLLLRNNAYSIYSGRVQTLDSLILNLRKKKYALTKLENDDHLDQRTTSSQSLDDLKERLGSKKSVLGFHWGNTGVYGYIVNPEGFHLYRVGYPDSLKADLLTLYQYCILRPDLIPEIQQQQIFEDMVKVSKKLFDILIKPVKKYLKQEVLIVPDAWLYYLPFDFLIEQPAEKYYYFRSHRYFFQSHAIGMAFSAHDALAIYEKAKFKRRLLAIAPSFDNHTELPKLLNNVEEAKKVSNIFNGEIWISKEASKDKFAKISGRYQMILLATHGIMDEEYPEYSHVAFTKQSTDFGGANLYLSEIVDMDFRAELIVLSACQTLNGTLYRGEGLLSIAHAFLLSGSESFLASLWNVDDSRTPGLMEKFFQFLKVDQPKHVALQKAKNGYIEKEQHLKAHPFYWSGFMLFGSTDPISKSDEHWYYYCCVIFSIILLIVFYKYRTKFKKQGLKLLNRRPKV